MKKDWFSVFLPLWMWGSIVWLIVGFVLLPSSFQKPVFGGSEDVYLGTMYDISKIDYTVLWQFIAVVGTPNIVFLVVFTLAAIQHVRGKPPKRPGPSRG